MGLSGKLKGFGKSVTKPARQGIRAVRREVREGIRGTGYGDYARQVKKVLKGGSARSTRY